MTELTNLWDSTRDLYTRFDVTITQDASALVFSEETKELLAAQTSEPAVNVAEEAADVIVTAMGVCMSRGVTLAQLLSAMRHVTLKNDSKTLQTHAVNAAGKIARKG